MLKMYSYVFLSHLKTYKISENISLYFTKKLIQILVDN